MLFKGELVLILGGLNSEILLLEFYQQLAQKTTATQLSVLREREEYQISSY